ncbi:hypothetical protein [Nocardia rhamnosiphila]
MVVVVSVGDCRLRFALEDNVIASGDNADRRQFEAVREGGALFAVGVFGSSGFEHHLAEKVFAHDAGFGNASGANDLTRGIVGKEVGGFLRVGVTEGQPVLGGDLLVLLSTHDIGPFLGVQVSPRCDRSVGESVRRYDLRWDSTKPLHVT